LDVCTKCQSYCQTCSNLSSCDTCALNLFKHNVLGITECLNSCPKGFYPDTNRVCQSCPITCGILGCTGPTKCNTCAALQY